MAQSITNIDDAKLITVLKGAERRVVFLAPGISEEVAGALADAWSRLGPDAVTVILDVDSEVCRLGYGTLKGLKIMKEAAQQFKARLCHQPGIRIGLLIVDDMAFVYSPTPLLIEAGSTQPERPNAIKLGGVPEPVAREVGLGDHPNVQREIGLDLVTNALLTQVEDDLGRNPPAKFDLARKVRVFSSYFQFVEFELTGCFLSKKKVRIPSELIGLAEDKETRDKLHASFDLVGRTELNAKVNGNKVTEESLRARRTEIMRKYLISLKGYGSVVLKINKQELEKAVEELRQEVRGFQQQLSKALEARMDTNRKTLVKALLPTVVRNPPERYVKYLGPKPRKEGIQQLLEQDISDAFGRPEALLEQMNVTLVFKDIAYESLVEEDFLRVASMAMPHFESLHQEYEAVRAGEAGKSLR